MSPSPSNVYPRSLANLSDLGHSSLIGTSRDVATVTIYHQSVYSCELFTSTYHVRTKHPIYIVKEQSTEKNTSRLERIYFQQTDRIVREREPQNIRYKR